MGGAGLAVEERQENHSTLQTATAYKILQMSQGKGVILKMQVALISDAPAPVLKKLFQRRPRTPYSGSLRENPVTIAAGFRYENGILLCADREITEGASKFSASKVFGEQISPSVSLALTLAGGMDYAEMAIQEILTVVKSSHLSSHGEIWLAIKDIIREIYSESIAVLSEEQKQYSQFTLLIAVWAESNLKMYVTENTAIKEVSQFRCIGIGKELAKYILSRDGVEGSDRMPMQTAEAVALRILHHVKQSVSGCGKETDILILDSKGVLTRKTQRDYHFELKMVELYDDLANLLLPFSLELDMPERDREVGFRLALSNYFQRVKVLQEEKRTHEAEEGLG